MPVDKRLIKKDPDSGKETWVHMDTADGQWHFETVYPLDKLTEHNQRNKNDWKYGSLIGNTQKHHQKVAEIPAPLYYELCKKFGGNHKQEPKAWKAWLNDPDNAVFRTWGGKL